MKIYTKTGDDGTSGLYGGKRVLKCDARLEAYGTLDELNSNIGLILCEEIQNNTVEFLQWLQSVLFVAGTDLATPQEIEGKLVIDRIQETQVVVLEKMIDLLSEELPELRNFILPGGTRAAAQIHIARCVCRRAERQIVLTKQNENINENLLTFVNRLSDYFFVLARYENFRSGIAETLWKKQ